MKLTKLLSGMAFVAAMGLMTVAQAQISTPAASPLATFKQVVGLTTIEVSYSRPSVKGRTVFGDVVPYGSIWRTGANGATTISFSDDVKLEGKDVKAGTYALYTIPGKDSWTVMLYSDLRLGGNVGGYDATKEVVRFTVTPQALPYTVESFLIIFDDLQAESANMYLIWEKTMVPVKVSAAADSRVMAQIERVMAGPTAGDYYAAASYYLSTERELAKALEWVNKSIEMGNDRYWVHTQKARILGKMGKKAEAIAASKKAQAMAQESGDAAYVKINQDLQAEWSK